MTRSRIFTIAAVVILGLMAIILFISGGIPNIIIALVGIALAVLGWRRPLVAGIILAALGFILAFYFLATYSADTNAVTQIGFICLPMVGSGLLFIEGDWAARKASRE